jgi:LDH2 family malate/lactate/ureidoglycolate dehydrogenase
LSPDEARARLEALGFDDDRVGVLVDHFTAAEESGRESHGYRRIDWIESWPDLRVAAEPARVVSEPGYERWRANGAVGYLVLDAVVRAQLAEPPQPARLVVCDGAFPTGMLGYWVRRLAEGGLVAVLTATSPRRLGHPDGGPKLTGTNPLAIAVPSSDGKPLVADVSMGNLTYGDVLAGRAREDELAPFGGGQAYKAFALAAGLQLLVDALTPSDGFGAVLVVARPEADPVPAFRELARGVRLPGDQAGKPGSSRIESKSGSSRARSA